MSRETIVLIDGQFVTKAIDGETTAAYARLRDRGRRGPAVHSDDLGLNGLVNHADGKRYDSKSEFRKATRKAGCYEVGNDKNDLRWKPPIERGIRGDFNVRPALKEALQRTGIR